MRTKIKSPRLSVSIPLPIYNRIVAHAELNGLSLAGVVIQILVEKFGIPPAESRKLVGQGEDLSASPQDPENARLVELANRRFPKSPSPEFLHELPDSVAAAHINRHHRELDAIMDARRETGIMPLGGKGEAATYARMLQHTGRSRLLD